MSDEEINPVYFLLLYVRLTYETGAPHTAHTTNPVPFILYNYGEDVELREGGCLADIAPTLLEVMGLPQPKEMTGKSLIVRK